MESKSPNKIHIIGSVGSGKTTLAKWLSTKLDIPFYELDNIVWKRHKSGDIRRNDEERDEYLSTLVDSDSWIIEGVHYEWVLQSFQKADLIIVLDTAYSKRTVRIIKRFILQKVGLEQANYKPTFEILRRMFTWNANYEKDSKPEIVAILSQYNDKLIILKNDSEIEEYFSWLNA
ncbi:AAA family ATPase [Sporosarcina limicola]|uniref:Adenylate kinase family enzyme n=1 Tax=Sporosarcina limicola TaxID=34101 RepID=A0A927MPA2_9BACL|nr:AAA family ATPase [Sporosarcina limicola]MBE1556777.1 adenylate kinase family enzyme [Sporosarcina limicola]